MSASEVLDRACPNVEQPVVTDAVDEFVRTDASHGRRQDFGLFLANDARTVGGQAAPAARTAASLRVAPSDEGLGLDVTQHGEEAYVHGDGAILISPAAGFELERPLAQP